MKPQPLTEEHLPAAVALAAAAFANSVAYVSICPDADRRREFLEWLFTVNARRGMEHGYALCVVDDEGEVICFFLLAAGDPEDGHVGHDSGRAARSSLELWIRVDEAPISYEGLL